VLAHAPPNADWRPLVEQGVAALSRNAAVAPAAPAQPQSPKEASPRSAVR
jgi:hypothetical protein